MGTRPAVVLAIALMAGFAACEDDPIAPDEEFAATLGPEGSVQTPATGSAVFERHGGVVAYGIEAANITGVTAAHIHGPAGAGEGAGIIVGLFEGPEGGSGDIDGALVTGAFTAADLVSTTVSMDSLLSLMRSGQAYVNVHTVENPGGEIRGQIERL